MSVKNSDPKYLKYQKSLRQHSRCKVGFVRQCLVQYYTPKPVIKQSSIIYQTLAEVSGKSYAEAFCDTFEELGYIVSTSVSRQLRYTQPYQITAKGIDALRTETARLRERKNTTKTF